MENVDHTKNLVIKKCVSVTITLCLNLMWTFFSIRESINDTHSFAGYVK